MYGNELLVEIFTEEVPYKLQKKCEDDFKNIVSLLLKKYEIKYGKIELYSTNQRIAIVIDGLSDEIVLGGEEKRGPKEGANAKAIEGFLKSCGYGIEEKNVLKIKNGYFFAETKKEEFNLKNKLPKILEEIFLEIKFLKSMSWNESKIKWARPIRNILAIYGGEVLDFQFAGIKANNTVKGHRFLSEKKLGVESSVEYFEFLKNNFVIIDFKQRKNIILQEINNIAKELSLEYLENNSLLEELCYLVEYPCFFVAEFDKKYLELPQELIVSVIVSNQKYINLFEKNGKISNKFIIVANNFGNKLLENNIILGNQKVVKARLEDALFFYKEDLKFAITTEELNTKVFYQNFTYLDKVHIMQKTAKIIFDENLDYEISVLKVDLISKVVNEIPELQGIMGKYYLEVWNKNNKNYDFIREHYKPLFADDSLPSTILAAKLSIIDKLISLQIFFECGVLYSSSSDMLGLRRIANGIFRILIDFKFDIKFNSFDVKVCDFLENRFVEFLQHKLEKDNYNKAIIQNLNHYFDLWKQKISFYKIFDKLTILNNYFDNEVFQNIRSLVLRIENVAGKELDKITGRLNLKIFEEEEKKLFNSLDNFAIEIDNIDELLIKIKNSKIIENTTLFFDKILVNDKNLEKRNNRLLLLKFVKDKIKIL